MSSHKLLDKYYTEIDTVLAYLERLVPEVFLELPDDPPSFVSFLSTCLVACHPATVTPEPVFDFYESTQTQSEVSSWVFYLRLSLTCLFWQLIKKAQFKLLKARQRNNVLNLGFRLVRRDILEVTYLSLWPDEACVKPDERDNTHDVVVNFAVNTNVDKLKTPDWRKLLRRYAVCLSCPVTLLITDR